MGVALRDHSAGDAPSRAPRSLLLDRVVVYEDFAAAEPAWRRLESAHAHATPYQRYEWAKLWHEHVSRHESATPLIVVGLDGYASPLFLWPFVRDRMGSITTARYLGRQHSNLNAGIWRRDIAKQLSAEDLRRVFGTVACAHGIDLFVLCNQPMQVGAIDNPLALLPHQRSPDDVHSRNFGGRTGEQALKQCLNAAMRGRLRTKERKFSHLADYRYARAATAAEADRFFDAFLAQKGAHLSGQGIDNVFADSNLRSFLRAACHEGLAAGRPVIELHALEGGGEVIAVFGGVNDGRRVSCMFNSYTLGDNKRWSPGLILLTHLVRYCADNHVATLDLGIGHARYKTFFCNRPERLFDTLLAFSPRGRLAALLLRVKQTLKRWIKATPPLWNAFQATRRRLRG